MAKTKKTTEEDVEIERIKASLERWRLVCITIQRCFLMAMVSVWVGLIAWATVQLAKPTWVVVLLAILGASGPPSLVA
jgi:hypothetical protein